MTLTEVEMKFTVLVGSPNGSMYVWGPFETKDAATIFMNEEACSRLPHGYRMHVQAMNAPEELPYYSPSKGGGELELRRR